MELVCRQPSLSHRVLPRPQAAAAAQLPTLRRPQTTNSHSSCRCRAQSASQEKGAADRSENGQQRWPKVPLPAEPVSPPTQQGNETFNTEMNRETFSGRVAILTLGVYLGLQTCSRCSLEIAAYWPAYSRSFIPYSSAHEDIKIRKLQS